MNNTESFFTLAQIQNWFLQVISHPGGVRAENAATDSLNGLPMDEENVTALLTASHRLSPWERIGIYSHA